MSRRVFLDPRINKHLDHMRRSGKKAVLAAARAEEIISRLRAGGMIPGRVGTVTKHGELRIKGVMKYDLGNGYRLVTYKTGDCFFLLYAGTHDDCHRWIENNRELTPDQVVERCTPLPVSKPAADTTVQDHALSTENQVPEWDPLADIDEQLLRRAFSGLADGQRPPGSTPPCCSQKKREDC